MFEGHGGTPSWLPSAPRVRCRFHPFLSTHWDSSAVIKAQATGRGGQRPRMAGPAAGAAAGAGEDAGAAGARREGWLGLALRLGSQAALRLSGRRLPPPPLGAASCDGDGDGRDGEDGRARGRGRGAARSHARHTSETSTEASSLGVSSSDSAVDSDHEFVSPLGQVRKQLKRSSASTGAVERAAMDGVGAGAGDRLLPRHTSVQESVRIPFLTNRMRLRLAPAAAHAAAHAPAHAAAHAAVRTPVHPAHTRAHARTAARPAAAATEDGKRPSTAPHRSYEVRPAYSQYLSTRHQNCYGGVTGVGASGSWTSPPEYSSLALCPTYSAALPTDSVTHRRVPPPSVMSSPWWRSMEEQSPAFAAISQRFHVIAHAQARERLASNMARAAALQEQEQVARDQEEAQRFALGMPALARWAHTPRSDPLAPFLLRAAAALFDLALELVRHIILIGWVFLGVFSRLAGELISAKRPIQTAFFIVCILFAGYAGIFDDVHDLDGWFWD